MPEKWAKIWGIIVLVIIALIVIGAIIFYQIKGHENEAVNSSQPRSFKVGVVIPLTGPVGYTGQDFLNGLLLAKEKLNSNIELYIEDSKSNAKDGVTAAKMLLDTKNVDVLVSLQSAVVMPVLSLAEQYKKPLIATAISKDEFTTQSEYAFRLFPPARQDAAMAAEFVNKKELNKIALLIINDEYGVSMKEHFKKNFQGTISHEESFETSNNDFRTVLLKISDSDAVFFVGYIPQYINLYKQIKEQGLDIKVISNLIMVSNSVKTELGDLLTNSFATVPVSTLGVNSTGEFAEAYRKKYNKEPDWSAPLGYDMSLILDAVQKSNKAPLEALHEIKVNGLNGVIAFDENRESNIPLTMVEADKGIIKEIVE